MKMILKIFDEFEKNQGRVNVENLEKTLSGSLFSDYVLNLRFSVL